MKKTGFLIKLAKQGKLNEDTIRKHHEKAMALFHP